MLSFLPSFYKFALMACYVSGTVPGGSDMGMSKEARSPPSQSSSSKWESGGATTLEPIGLKTWRRALLAMFNLKIPELSRQSQ